MTVKIKALFNIQQIPSEFRDEFEKELLFANFNRVRIFSVVILAFFPVLILLTALRLRVVIYNPYMYHVLITQVIASALLLVLTLAMNIRPLRRPDLLTLRHRIMIFLFVFTIGMYSISVTVIGQHLSHQITPYIMMVVGIAVVLFMRSLSCVIMYSMLLAAFIIGVGYVQKNTVIMLSHFINGSMLTGISAVLSRVVFSGFKTNFLHRKTVEMQNEEIHAMAERLRISGMEYRHLFENSPIGIFRTDFYGHVFEMNPAALRMLKFNNFNDVNDLGVINIFESRSERERLIQMVREGTVSGFETYMRRSDGGMISVSLSMYLETDDDGKPLYLEGTIEDITMRRQADRAIQESEEQYRSLFEGSRDAIMMTDHDGFIDCNSAALSLFGLSSKDQFILQRPADFSPPKQPDGGNSEDLSRERIEAALREGGQFFEWIHMRKDGTLFPSEVMLSRIDYHGKTMLQAVVRDITERKRSEEALRESQRFLADIISFMPIATMVIDSLGRVTAWNRAMEEMTGVRSRDIMWKGNYEYAIPFYGEKRPILIDHVFHTEEELSEKYRHIHREGGILTAEAFIPKLGRDGIILVGFASILRDAYGNAVGAIESIMDVTEIRRAEVELKEARNTAEEANRSKSVFLANMSHEIRTPMNAILGYAQLMQRDMSLNDELKDYLSVINRSGEHLLSLINDILEMSKIEAGRSVFTQKTFDLHGLLEDLEVMFRLQTDAKGLSLLIEKVGDVPRWIISDEGKLRQVLINLIGNAVKFTSEGGVALRVCLHRASGSLMQLLFEVEDSGPGIAEEEVDRVFRAFEQTKTGIRIGGTGLGLALSRGFVEIMGGTLTLKSNPGSGCIFKFDIHAGEGKEENTECRKIKRRVIGLKGGQEDIRILIADDQDTNRRLLTRMLGNVGFKTREAANGFHAIEIFNEWEPGIILMDMTMPVMDGYETTRRIKATPKGKLTAVVAVTASAFEEHKRIMIASGIDGYLSKPFKEEELFDIIREMTHVEYLYEDEGESAESPHIMASMDSIREAVSVLSPELVRRMHDATMRANMDLLNEMLDEVSNINPSASDAIRSMAARYEYEKLLKLFS